MNSPISLSMSFFFITREHYIYKFNQIGHEAYVTTRLMMFSMQCRSNFHVIQVFN